MEWVVKVGGSLFPEDAVKLCRQLVGSDTLVVCGGGALANRLRDYDARMGFSDTANHMTAILCMDILGMLLADKVPDALAVYSILDAKKAVKNGKLPVLLPSRLMEFLDPLKHSWSVTSDSIACYVSQLLKAKLLIATDVDGIYTSYPPQDDAKLIKNISAKKLLNFGETSVDETLGELLLQYKSTCYVVNGRYPERVLAVIKGKNSKYTLIGGD